MTFEQLVQDDTAEWTRRSPADPDALARIAAAFPQLPADYLSFLALSDGGEGVLGVEPGWFVLWSTEELSARNQGYRVAKYLPGFTAFGSSGGGEMLAFAPDRRVVMVPFIPMQPSEAIVIAASFTALVRAFGRDEAAV